MKEEFVKIHGIQLAVDSKKLTAKMMNVIKSGDYEREEASMITSIIQPGERVVELGGGLGLVSAIVGKTGRAQDIVVYEANPDLIRLIERTHSANNVKSTVKNSIVLPRKDQETVPFYVRDDFWASSLSGDTYGYNHITQVPVESFGDMIRAHNPTMLIVDIEGGELDLFYNVDLSGISKVYMEIHQHVLGRVGVKRVFDFFSQQGFHYDQWHSSHGVILFSHVLRT